MKKKYFKIAIILFILINFIPAFSQHWEFAPEVFHSDREQTDLIRPILVVGDSLKCRTLYYFSSFHNHNWKFESLTSFLKSNLPDSLLVNLTNINKFIHSSYFDRNNKMYLCIDFKNFKAFIYHNGSEYAMLDSIYDGMKNKKTRLPDMILSIAFDSENVPYYVMSTRDEYFNDTTRLCKLENDTLKTLYIFRNQNHIYQKYLIYLLKFDNDNNLWVNTKDTLFCFSNDLPKSKHSLKDISNKLIKNVEIDFSLQDLFVTKDNTLIAIDLMGYILYFKENKWSIDDFMNKRCNYLKMKALYYSGMISMDNDDNLYTTASSNYIYVKKRTGEWKYFYNETGAQKFFIDSQNRIWSIKDSGFFGIKNRYSNSFPHSNYTIGVYYPED